MTDTNLDRQTLSRLLDGIASVIVRRVDQSLDNIYRQLECLGALDRLLDLELGLPPTRGWAASPDILLELVHAIDRLRPRLVLDIGSGTSTVTIAAALRKLGQGRVIALDHDPRYAARTVDDLKRRGLDGIGTVVTAPLGEVRIGSTTWTWYDLPPRTIPSGVDLVFIDGPPGATGPLARYPALPVLARKLSPGATLILDDARRADEQEVVRRWQARYPTMTVSPLEVEKGGFICEYRRPARSGS